MNDSSSVLHRNASVDMDDKHGFWVAQATGSTGETWWSCSRSGHIAAGLAVYASMFGESPVKDWDTSFGKESPYTIGCGNRDEAIAEFERRERIWGLSLRCDVSMEDVELAIDYAANTTSWTEVERILVDVEGLRSGGVHRIIKELRRRAGEEVE